MENAKQQLVDRLKSANNILVSVSRDPSVDQLSALLGLTLFLNKQGKHAAAVFSGRIPSTIEFLQPEETFEKNTDSLRDFIIALDKNKADKLRYKVEDDVVRIFITPYKTSINQEDFDFSQGDFNVDVVLALGVLRQEDLDEAITAHGRILHDATLTSINIGGDGGLGSINWQEPTASSLSELVTELTQELGTGLLDEQIATALLTGIVAETDRFSNDKTTSETMSMSALLMSAGANQQLVASKLAEPGVFSNNTPDGEADTASDESPSDEPTPGDGGTLEISHDEPQEGEPAIELPAPEEDTEGATEDTGAETELPPEVGPSQAAEPSNMLSGGSRLITEPPTMGGVLTANSSQEAFNPSVDPSLDASGAGLPPLLDHNNGTAPPVVDNTAVADDAPTQPPEPAPNPSPVPEAEVPVEPQPPISAPDPVAPPQSDVPAPVDPGLTPPPPAWVPPTPDPFHLNPVDPAIPSSDPTLADLEHSLDSPHVAPENIEDARDEVDKALSSTAAPTPTTQAPIEALNAQPFGGDLHPDQSSAQTFTPPPPLTDLYQPPAAAPAPPPDPQAQPAATDQPQVFDPTAPPPVPPPIPFQFGGGAPPQQ